MTIEDVLYYSSQYGQHWYLILDRMPAPLFERKGNWLIGEDSGFFKFYAYEAPGPGWKAFGGSKFDIPLKDGSVEHAYGQWWDYKPADFEPTTRAYGMATKAALAHCHVFTGGFHVDQVLVDDWLQQHEPSNNYNKYNPRHPDFGKQTIGNQWD
jgi:hypothetical protein